MKFRSNRKVRNGKKVLINLLYRLGIKSNDIAKFTNISRATVYRHIER